MIDDGEPLVDHLPGHGHHPPIHPVGQVRLAERRAEEQLARLQVVDDVHALQHHAGDAPVARRLGHPARQQEERLEIRRLRHRHRHPVSVRGAKVLDRLGQDDPEPGLVTCIGGVEELEPQEAVDLVGGPEVEPAPVDDRAAPEDEAQDLQVTGVHYFVSHQRPRATAATTRSATTSVTVSERLSGRGVGRGARARWP
jgi:hypothetical protein